MTPESGFYLSATCTENLCPRIIFRVSSTNRLFRRRWESQYWTPDKNNPSSDKIRVIKFARTPLAFHIAKKMCWRLYQIFLKVIFVYKEHLLFYSLILITNWNCQRIFQDIWCFNFVILTYRFPSLITWKQGLLIIV